MAGTFPDFNQVVLMGNLVRDPELKETKNGNTVLRTALAMNRPMGSENPTQFIQLTIFNTKSEPDRTTRIAGVFKKGSRVLVSGKLQVDDSTNDEGVRRTYVSILVDDLRFSGAGPRPAEETEEEEAPAPKLTPQRPAAEEPDFLNLPAAPAKPRATAPVVATRPAPAAARKVPGSGSRNPF